MSNLKQKLVDRLIEVLKQDIESGDTTVLDEILMKCPADLLLFSLPEEEWGQYKNALETKPTRLQKSWIKKCLEYLVFDEDDSVQTILNTVAIIRDHKDQLAMIDHILGDNVSPVQRFEHTFTCKDFLEQIGYK